MTFVKRYARVWLCLVRNSFQTQMNTSLSSLGYFVGKLFRIGFFLVYLVSLFRYVPSLKGYSMPQAVLFFLTFNFVDIGAQFLFRGLYGVKMLIDEGDFDKILTQPVHPLFRISFMGVDLLDLLTILPIGFLMLATLHRLPAMPSASNVFFFFLLLLNALVIAYSFHVLIAGVAVLTQEFHEAIWVYRDLMTFGRFPVSIYGELLRGVLVSVIPVGLMVSFPSDAMLGLLSKTGVVYALGVGFLFYAGSQIFWRFALRRYTSNSV